MFVSSVIYSLFCGINTCTLYKIFTYFLRFIVYTLPIKSISAKINFNPAIQSFHLVINDKEYKTGLPSWIVYESIDDNSGKITFNGITRDYTIEVIIDDDIFVESK